MEKTNLLEDLPGHLDAEQFETLVESGFVHIERIVSQGQSSPEGFWYDQETHEWVLVLKGKAGLEFEASQEIVEMSPGDCLNIPAHRRHRVAWTAAEELTVWLAVHY